MRRQAGPASAAPRKGTSVDDLLGKEGNEHSRNWASGKEEVVGTGNSLLSTFIVIIRQKFRNSTFQIQQV